MADTLDILTLAEAGDALPGTATKDSTKLAMLITAVSRTLDKLCGPIVVRAMPTRTVYTPNRAIWLEAPAASTTFAFSAVTVTEYQGSTGTALTAENVAAATANDYLLGQPPGPFAGRLVRRSSLYDTAWSGQQVTIAYSAGRYATTALVGAEFKQAAKEILRHNWVVEQGFSSLVEAPEVIGSTFTVPKKVLAYLTNELLGPGVA